MSKQNFPRNKFIPIFILTLIISVVTWSGVQAAPKPVAKPLPVVSVPAGAPQAQPDQTPLNLWELAKAGGFVMIVILLMSIGGVTLIFYNAQTLHADKLVPPAFGERLMELMERSDESSIRKMTSSQPNIFSRIVVAGLSKKRRGPVFVREAMENAARQEIGKMWHQISYLADLGTIGPLVGLFGTVLGMIQGFSAIAVQAGAVKPVLLVGGVSKAMVCTAGGLIVAIPALLAYTYFKGTVIRITRTVETTTAEMIKILEDRHEDFKGDTYVQI